MKSFKTIFVIICIMMASCHNQEKPLQLKETNFFVSPPLASADIEFQHFEIDAEKGDTFVYENGSVVVFPPNSLLYADGSPVKGKADISYREFDDPLDFYFSGIPMEYDSAGTNYVFESAGMCEIYGSQNGKEIFVNPENQPSVNLISFNDDPRQNLYYLDTVQQKWVYMGKDQIMSLEESPVVEFVEEIEAEIPVKPQKANASRPSISITFDPDVNPELLVYQNTFFEIDEDDTAFSFNDSNVDWFDVKIEKAEQKGKYWVTFTNFKRTVSYLTRPVLEGEDYEIALKEFEAREKEYEKLKSVRLAKEELEQKRLDSIEKEWEEKMKLVIAAREKEAELMKKKKEELIKKRRELTRQREANNFAMGGMSMEGEVMRSFNMNRFGIWNCDRPVFQRSRKILANYYDMDGNPLKLNKVNVVYKDINGIRQFWGNELALVKESEMMLWAVMNEKLVYLKYDEFARYKFPGDQEIFQIFMNVSEQQITSKQEVREILGI